MLVLAATLLLSAPLPAGDPFSELSFEAALARAQSEKKLLVLDFTADWCPPCKKMDKDTWGSPEVRAWLAENALALQIDVDHEKELAQRFKVQSLPTVVALRDGQEFERFIGYRDAGRFLVWAGDVRAGKRESDALAERARALADSSDVNARRDIARELLAARQYETALPHYLWLWPNTRSVPSYGGVRLSFLLAEMAQLAQRYAPAKEACAKLFAEVEARVQAEPKPSFEAWQEFSAFCGYFDGRARMLAWYEGRRDAAGRLFAGEDDFLARFIAGEVFAALIAAGRPEDAVRLFADARAYAAELVRQYKEQVGPFNRMEESMRRDFETRQKKTLTENLATLHAALLLVGRSEEASAVAALLLETLDDADARLALVRQGLALTKRNDASFTRWLAEAEAAGSNVTALRRKLERLAAGESDG